MVANEMQEESPAGAKAKSPIGDADRLSSSSFSTQTSKSKR
jgi:hypothetical protein